MNTVYICDYVRTPFGRFGGSLASVRPDDLAALVLKALIERNPNLDPARIEDVILGCANQAGEDNRNVARMGLLLAGLPVEVPGTTMNRLCGSGMDAILTASRAIQAGAGDLYIAGGVESMSRAPFVMPKAESAFSRSNEMHDTTIGWRFINPKMQAAYGTDSMPETAENVAEDFGISREDQDAFAFRSQQKAAAAQEAGRLAEEVVNVEIQGRKGKVTVVSQDEHLRPDTSLEQLAALKAPFRAGGSITAGNASGVNDGAAAMILASEQAVNTFGLTPRARIIGGTCAGVPPRVMGIGPAPASQKLLERFQFSTEQLDVIEFNEAFAAQALASARQLGLADDDPRINPNGGAIALGHPLGASGVRILGSALHQLERQQGQRALAAMCIGVGQGIASLIERV